MPLLRREEGQTMAEYSVVLAMIVVVTLVAYMALGNAAAALMARVTAIL
jgi:Flp pilus assembly pilin Flp